MDDTTQALLTILRPESTVPQLEEAADRVFAAHPERPRASLVRLLAAEALEARAALKQAQRLLEARDDAHAKHLASSCESCFWQDGDMCLKFSEPYERLGSCRAGYKPARERPGTGSGVPLQLARSWTS
jgi:hypothetical protein